MRRLIAIAALAASSWPVLYATAAAEPLRFAGRPNASLPLSIARYGADSADGSLALISPQQQWSAKRLDLELDTGGEFECGGSGTIADAVAAANQAPPANPEEREQLCQFMATLLVGTAEPEPIRLDANCEPWLMDVSWCTLADAPGQFWLQRPVPATGKPRVLTVVFGRPPADAPSAPVGPEGVSADGINIGPASDDTDADGMPRAYLWVVWPPGGTSLVVYP